MSHRRLWIWKFLIAATSLLLLILFVAIPVASSILIRQTGSIPDWLADYLQFSERLVAPFMMVFVVVWIFFLGGTFASFLNVVACRVPRGRSILGSSHCPHCNVKLSFKDNFPIVGWLKNGGRCSTCRLPIAKRYVLVEIALGLIFILIVAVELVTGGATLPIREPNSWMGLNRMLLDARPDLIQIVANHLVMMLVLFTFVLIEIDQLRIPLSVFLTGLVFAILIPVTLPAATILNWQFPFVETNLPNSRLDGVCGIFAGVVCGVIVGAIIDRLRISLLVRPVDETGAGDESPRPQGLVFGLATVGAFVGWQSAVVVGVVVCLILVAIRQVRKFPNAIVLLTTLAHLATWRWMNWLP